MSCPKKKGGLFFFCVFEAVFDGFDVATIVGYAYMGALVALLSGNTGIALSLRLQQLF
jgi:hypothetical protein